MNKETASIVGKIGLGFKESDAILRMDIPREKYGELSDTPDEYIVLLLSREYGGCMVCGRYGDRWETNVQE